MKIIKGLALSLLSFLLFLSLTIFSVVFTLSSTVLNSNFLTSQLDKLDVSALVQEITVSMPAEGDFPEELRTAMIDTIDRLEAPVKAQLSAVINETYDYLLGKREQPDLTATLGNTFLNSDFVDSVMNELDLSSLAKEFLGGQMGGGEFPEGFSAGLVNTITELEPMIKEKISAASEPVFEYLLGETQSIDLALTLRNTVLTSDFVLSLTDKLDISSLASEFLSEELTGQIPEEMGFLLEHLDDAIAGLEPTIKAELSEAADDILDYLLGVKESINVVISLQPVMGSLKDTLREIFMEQLPAEYADLPQSQLDQLFEETFAELTATMPASFDIGGMLAEMLPASQVTDALTKVEDGLKDTRQGITDGIAQAEDGLEEAKKYVGYFQIGYWCLLGLMALLILGIVLIHREVKGATRGIGITALTYGAIQSAGILVGKNLIEPMITEKLLAEQMKTIPAALQDLPTQLLDGFTSPMQMLSLGLLIGGVVLIVVSFVYPRLRQTAAEAED